MNVFPESCHNDRPHWKENRQENTWAYVGQGVWNIRQTYSMEIYKVYDGDA